jgi:catechol 2,3-dioxygenase-like lactoylglutathione lyase family enzyme
MPTVTLALVLAVAALAAAAPAQAPAPVPAPGAPLQANVLAAAQPSGTFFALSVSNAAVTARWYEEMLGFRVFKRIELPNGGRIVLMENEGAILELIQSPTAKAPAAWHADAKESFMVRGYFKAGFRVAHLDRLLEALRAKKVEIRHGPFDIPEIKVRSFIVADPDGNLLQFFG